MRPEGARRDPLEDRAVVRPGDALVEEAREVVELVAGERRVLRQEDLEVGATLRETGCNGRNSSWVVEKRRTTIVEAQQHPACCVPSSARVMRVIGLDVVVFVAFAWFSGVTAFCLVKPGINAGPLAGAIAIGPVAALAAYVFGMPVSIMAPEEPVSALLQRFIGVGLFGILVGVLIGLRLGRAT